MVDTIKLANIQKNTSKTKKSKRMTWTYTKKVTSFK